MDNQQVNISLAPMPTYGAQPLCRSLRSCTSVSVPISCYAPVTYHVFHVLRNTDREIIRAEGCQVLGTLSPSRSRDNRAILCLSVCVCVYVCALIREYRTIAFCTSVPNALSHSRTQTRMFIYSASAVDKQITAARHRYSRAIEGAGYRRLRCSSPTALSTAMLSAVGQHLRFFARCTRAAGRANNILRGYT